MQEPTPRQLEIRDYIASHIGTHGRGPSADDIRRHFNIASKATVLDHLNRMEKKGLIFRPRHSNASPAHQATTAQITLEPIKRPACCPHCRRPFGQASTPIA